MAAAVVHKEQEIIIILNNSASVLDARMTAIRVALENASETRDTITIHTDSLTAVNINRKLDLITMAIRYAAPRLTQGQLLYGYRPILGNENADQAAKRGLQLHRIHTTLNASTFREQARKK